MYLIVGLGNPGAKYAHTRHNVGFDVLDALSKKLNVSISRERDNALIGECFVGGQKVILAMPQTYMNLSGEAVMPLANYFKIPPENLLVVYDDIDLPQGHIRIRKNGSAGTHNGMRSIIAHTPSQEFPRIRVGVGAKPEGWELVNWVLSHYQTPDDREAMQKAFTRAVDCVEDWIKNGVEHAMQTANRG